MSVDNTKIYHRKKNDTIAHSHLLCCQNVKEPFQAFAVTYPRIPHQNRRLSSLILNKEQKHGHIYISLRQIYLFYGTQSRHYEVP